MCGIAGLASPTGGVDADTLLRMRDALVHRGPDDAGHYVDASRTVGLAHRRLSVIDLSAHGHQPMCNEDGSVWLVFNGEIYGFGRLRDELRAAGHAFRSQTDSEVIVHAYEQWGVGCLRRLRGMFAFALWDARRRRLLLARDRLGIKPLFYSVNDGRLSFGSELKAVVADPGVRLALDESAIYDFFTYRYVPTPKTIYAAVRKLPPGHYATWEDGRLALHEYWDVPFTSDGPRAEGDAVELVRSKLAEAVATHLVADVPVGVMLSGGLDSSTLLALAAPRTDAPLHTFSIGFDVAAHSETAYARLMAERHGSLHHELTLTREMAGALERSVLALYDEPFADSSATPTFVVSKLARGDVTVALSGEGGDEIFGGYQWYSSWWRLRNADLVPRAFRRLAALPMRLLPVGTRGKWTLEMAALDPIERYGRAIAAFSRRDKRSLLARRFYSRFDGYDDYWHFRRYWREDLDPYSRMQYLDLKTYLNDDLLTKLDRASMAVSLEARVPLLDHELLEAVFSLPVAIRNRDGAQKYLLRKAVAGLVPAEILGRGKRGFSVPLYDWLRKPDARALAPILDNDFVSPDLLRANRVTGSDLWPFIVMGRWLGSHA